MSESQKKTPQSKSTLETSQPQNQPASQSEPETKILTGTTAPDTSSDPIQIEPDWDTIKTPEELQAEADEAELTAIVEGEEDAERDRFDELAKKGMHLIMTGTMHGARMGIKFKTGHELKSLQPKEYEPGLKQAHDCMVDLMELDPEGMVGKVLAWCGGFDERWAPILIAYAAVGDNVSKELKAIAEEQAKKAKEETPQDGSIRPDAPPAPPPAPESSEPRPIGVSQP